MTNPKIRRNLSPIASSKYASGQPPVGDRRQRLESLGQDPAEIARAKREIAQMSQQQGGRVSAPIQLDDVEVQQRKPLHLVVVSEPLSPPAPTTGANALPHSVEIHESRADKTTTDQQSQPIKVPSIQKSGISAQKKEQASGGAPSSRPRFERIEHQPVHSAAPARNMPAAPGAAYSRDERYAPAGAHPPIRDIYQPWEVLGSPARGQPLVLLFLVAIVSVAVIWMFFQSPKTFISTYGGAELGNTVGDVVSKVFGEDGKLSNVAVPAGEHSILGEPSITVDQIEAVLTQYNSPARGSGKSWFELGKRYGIDPAYPLAFFIQESTAGTNAGWAGLKSGGDTTHNVGNIICAGYATCYKGNRDYPSWEAGIDDWYRLIAREYVEGRGLASVEQILPVYCPVSDGCHSYDYITIVNSMVERWHQGQLFQ